jgi:hypothetical protein
MTSHSPSPHPPIAAYYQCYKQPKAFLHTVAAFRHHYPNTSLIITSDNGNDYTKAAHYFRAHYTHDTHQSGNNITNQLTSIENAKRYLERFFAAALQSHEDYFILLEDDVMIFHPIPHDILIADMIGCNRESAIIYPNLIANLQQYNPHIQPHSYYGGCGGTLFRTAFYKSLAHQVLPILDGILKEYAALNEKFDSDILLSYLTLRFHGTITGPPLELSEPYYASLSQLIEKGYVCVLHQYKKNYDQPLSPQELAILGWQHDGALKSDIVRP